MSNKNIKLAGLVLGSTEPVQLPTELQEFLNLDAVDGIDGFDVLLKNYKTAKKIPQDVRIAYEVVYHDTSLQLEDIADELEKLANYMRSNPKEFIHALIQQSLEILNQN